MARRTPHHAERPQDRRVPLTPQFGEPPPSESPGSRVPPQCDFWKRSGQHEPRKAPGSRGAPQRRHLLQPRRSHRLPKHLSPAKAPQPAPPESPGSRVPPQRDFWERSGQHEPRKAPGSRGALHRRHSPLHQRPFSPETHGIPYKPHGYFPTLRKAGRPRKVSFRALAP